MSKTYVVYNAHTMDGQASALAAYFRFKNDAIYLAFDYGKLSIFEYFTKGDIADHIYILGLHLTPQDLARISSYGKNVTYIDHMPVELSESSKTKITQFSIPERSTCVSAWSYFLPSDMVPETLLIIEDVVLHKNEISNSRFIYDGLRYKMLQCEEDAFLLNTQHFISPNLSELAVEGMQVGSFFQTTASYLASNCGYSNLLDYKCAFINAPKLFSYHIIKHLLSLGKYDYVFLYSDCRVSGYVYRSWSVGCRSGLDYDASLIANIFDGYGTQSFAGFVSSLNLRENDICSEIVQYINAKL
jgi:hypothetical protein